jgi:hypothetical protein
MFKSRVVTEVRSTEPSLYSFQPFRPFGEARSNADLKRTTKEARPLADVKNQKTSI